MTIQRKESLVWYNSLNFKGKQTISNKYYEGNLFLSNRDIEKTYVDIVILKKKSI